MGRKCGAAKLRYKNSFRGTPVQRAGKFRIWKTADSFSERAAAVQLCTVQSDDMTVKLPGKINVQKNY